MSAPTVSQIVRALERQRFQSDMSVLAQLDQTHSEAVQAALRGVPSRAKIDLRLLVSTVQRDVAERAEAEAAKPDDPMLAFNYFVGSIATPHELDKLRRALSAGATVDDALARVSCHTAPEPREVARGRKFRPAPVLLTLDDDDADDDADLRPKRRTRVRMRRDPPPAQPEPKPEPRPRQLLGGKVFGAGSDSRPYGCPVGADHSRWGRPSRPPWLIDDLDDEEGAAA